MKRVWWIWVCDWLQKKSTRFVNKLFRFLSLSQHHTVESYSGIDELLERHEVSGVDLSLWLMGKTRVIAQNELLLLQRFQEVISLARQGVPYNWERISQMDKERNAKILFSLGPIVWQPNVLAASLSLDFSPVFQRAAAFHTLRRLGEVAISLRLYRKEHGCYPEDLSALVPTYLPSIPLDPFNGKPLRYRREQKGFRIWSVGPDMKDGGGVTGEQWMEGDIVWTAVR